MKLKEFLNWKRPPVAYCQVDNHPIFGNPISADDPDYEIFDGKPICFEHFYDKLGDEVDKHPIGRGSPHGGCHGID